MSMVEIHAGLANATLAFVAVMAAWGLFRFFRRRGLGGSYWGAVVVAEILILAQGAIGIYLWLTGARPVRGGIHWLYGVVLALAIPLVYIYTKGREDRPEMLMYGVAFLIMIGLVLRSIVTGG